jgi:predicted nucleotidyltransferase component of viral defense system
MAVTNVAASVLARLKNQSKEEGIPFQVTLQLFAQEEFLRKLSKSQYVDNLILKGGMFIYTLTEFDSRPTRDIDFLLKNLHGSMENIEQTMKNICQIDIGNDFITLKVLKTETITADMEYPGVKTAFMANIGKVKIPFSIDVGIDDVIVPEPIKRSIITRLPEFKSPEILTYSLESTIAEKFDSILKRMDGTSRMKDFYDIFYLSGIYSFEGKVLTEALHSTLTHRHRELSKDVFDDIAEFKNNRFLIRQWKNFDPIKVSGLPFEIVIDRLIAFLKPVYLNILQGKEFNKNWKLESMKWV